MTTDMNLPEAPKPREYGAASIKVLKGLDAVRKRPGMYIGDTDDGSGLHHMVQEVVDNAIDECLAGHADRVDVAINADGSVSVKDNGRGIPVDIHPTEGVSAAGVIMTQLHAGGKFDQDSYKVSGGLHGVGVSVVNALSSWLDLKIWRDDREWGMRFTNGVAEAPLAEFGMAEPGLRGTLVTFMPSTDIFAFIDFDSKLLTRRLKDLAYLNPGVRIVFTDNRADEATSVEFYFENGINEFVAEIDKDRVPLQDKPLYVSGSLTVGTGPDSKEIAVDVSLQWNDGYSEALRAYTNTIPQKDGGTHVAGLRGAITKAFQTYMETDQTWKKHKDKLTGDDLREGFTAVLSVKVPDPKFSSQTKEKLVSSEVRPVVESLVSKELTTWLDENPAYAREIIDKAMKAALAREAARKARDVVRKKGGLDSSALAGKLARCTSKDPTKSELFIVEGDSAGGSAKQGRDRETQAVLPLRGKILNTERARFDKMMESKEILAITAALETGIGDDDFNPERCRYHKIILMTDADVDGSHIRTLLLTFLFRQMKPLIDRGYVYIAQPPLYRVKRGSAKEKFVANEAEMTATLIDYGLDAGILVRTDGTRVPNAEVRAALKQALTDRDAVAKAAAYLPNHRLAEVLITHGLLVEGFDDGRATQVCDRLKLADGGLWSWRKNDAAYVFDRAEDGVVQSFTADFSSLPDDQRRDLEKRSARFVTLYPLLSHFEAKDEKLAVASPGQLIDAVFQVARSGLSVQRYKGLGEMSKDQLWDTTLDPARRVLKQVTVTDVIEADKLFVELMGEAVDQRRRHIEEASIEGLDLDI